ncbi:MAG: hypothetical protein RLZZ267_843 [Bacillota bacterium]
MSCGNFSSGFSNNTCTLSEVQDKVCVNAERVIAGGENGTTQLFISNTFTNATGFFKVVASSDPAASFSLIFFLNGVAQSQATFDPVNLHETIAFTMKEFNEIRVSSSIVGTTLTYELSLTPRYNI